MHRSLYTSILIGCLTSGIVCQNSSINGTGRSSNTSIVHFETWKMGGNWTQYAPREFLQLYPDLTDDSEAQRPGTVQRIAAAGGTNGGLPNTDYGANKQGFSTTTINAIKIVGYVAGNVGPWINIGFECANGAGDAVPYVECITDIGQEIAAVCGAALASETQFGSLAVAVINRTFFHARKFGSAILSSNASQKKGNLDNGRDELRKARETGPDTCDGEEYLAQLASTTYDSAHTYKGTARSYCESLPSTVGEDVSAAVADAWAKMGYGERIAYTAFDTETGRVALRGVIDIIPPYQNEDECPAEIPGDADGCTCVNC